LLAFPVLAGKTNDDAKRFANEFMARPREYEASRRHAELTLERTYLQKTPMGAFVVTYMESNLDAAASLGLMAASGLAIDDFFARVLSDVHGIDLAQASGDSLPETVAVWNNAHVTSRGKGLAFVAPLIPDAADKASTVLAQEFTWKEFGQSRRASDQHLEVASLLTTPQGSMAAFYLEGADPVSAIERFMLSTRPYELRFRKLLAKLFLPIADVSQALADVEQIFDSTQVTDLTTGA
jgi:hypothetical protein